MRYIKFVLNTGYCGTQDVVYMKTDMDDRGLNITCSELAQENAEQYEYMIFGWGVDAVTYAEENDMSIEDAEQEIEDYYQDANDNSYWKEVSEEEYKENME